MNKPLRITLIEDNHDYREAICLVIWRDKDMELAGQFETAESALKSLKNQVIEAPHIILLDLHLPKMNGLDALPLLLKLPSTSNVIILTQSRQESDVLNAISMGASGYLLKSASVKEIKSGIRRVAEGGAYLDPDMAKFILKAFKIKSPNEAESINLSKREIEILELLAKGMVKKQISAEINIAYDTVDMHVRRIYQKLDVRNAPAAIAKAFRAGLLDTNE